MLALRRSSCARCAMSLALAALSSAPFTSRRTRSFLRQARITAIVCLHLHKPPIIVSALQFDDLLLLQRGGWLVYSGRLGHNASTLVRYLQALRGVQPAPPEQNVATWMLDVLAASHMAGAAPMGGAISVTVTTAVATGNAGTPQGHVAMDSKPLPNADNVASSASVASPPVAPEIVPQMSRKKRAVATGALLSGEDFQTRFFDSVSWQKQGSPQLERACVPTVTSTATSDLSTMAESDAAQTPSALVQYSVLANRELTTARRDIPFNLGRIGSLVFLNLLFGTIYYRSERATTSARLVLPTALFFCSFLQLRSMPMTLPVYRAWSLAST